MSEKNIVQQLLDLDDNHLIISFLDVCDDGLYEIFTEDFRGDVKRLRTYLSNAIVMHEVKCES